MARIEIQQPPRATTLADGRKVVDITVRFVEFPRAGLIRTNRPHVRIDKNDGEDVREDQPLFTGDVYQLDAERFDVVDGDVIKVSGWWSPFEVRDSRGQALKEYETYTVG